MTPCDILFEYFEYINLFQLSLLLSTENNSNCRQK